MCILLPEARLLTIELLAALSPFRPNTMFIINLLSRRHYITTVFYQVLTRKPSTRCTSVCSVGLHLRHIETTVFCRQKTLFLCWQLLEEYMSMPNLHSYSIKSRPLCSVCKAISETSMQLNSIICVCKIIYVVCHHLVCHWLGLLGLHFLRFTPTRAQAPGWLYKLWHTFLSITNLWVPTYLNSAFCYYKLQCIWLKWMCFPPCTVSEYLFHLIMLSGGK